MHPRYDVSGMNLVGSGKLSPSQLVESLVEATPQQLDQLFLGSLVLVIRAPDDDDTGAFLADLVRCALKDAPPRSHQGAWANTSEFPTVPAAQLEPSESDQIELLSELIAAPHCLVPLRGTERAIEIGRAPSADILLSDPSVSARHAQLVLADGGACVLDLGSKNGTLVNNRRITPTEQPWLQSMDRLCFGRIQGFVCDPRALRGVIRQSLRVVF
jgi:hypothetical protein